MKFPHKQRGMALVMLVFIIGLAAVGYLLYALNPATVKIERDKKTVAVLAEAKAALIGYAVKKPAVAQLGYFLNPDMGPGISISEGASAGGFAGNNADISLIGKLPWRTLGISPLRDGVGECLWFVVSGRFKGSPVTSVALNWDTQGQIDVIDGSGNTIATSLAALIASPGAVLDAQNRAIADATLIQCGGNYDARNYFDSYALADAISGEVNYFAASANNSLAPNTNNKRFVMAENSHYNDRLLFVSIDDIFRPIIHRSDFSAQISALLDDLDFKPHLQAVPIAGGKGTNNVDCTTITNATNRTFCNNWKDMLLLAELPAPSSITIDGAGTATCTRVLIFGGSRTGLQSRQILANIADPTNYLEGTNLTAFVANTSNYSGISTFNANNPSTDILRCL